LQKVTGESYIQLKGIVKKRLAGKLKNLKENDESFEICCIVDNLHM